MATQSTDNPVLGSIAPSFQLPDVRDGKVLSSASLTGDRGGRALLVMFICRHCPYVKHVESELARLEREAPPGLGIVAISSNDARSYPEDAPDSLAEQARLAGFTFPYLYDESQAVAKAYGAVCTPEFFLYDASRKLRYHGQLDDSRPGNGKPLTGKDLRAAIEAVLEEKAVPGTQRAAVGCSIKWKSA
jgi:thiol-disulfide isomerase/thioredoxin